MAVSREISLLAIIISLIIDIIFIFIYIQNNKLKHAEAFARKLGTRILNIAASAIFRLTIANYRFTVSNHEQTHTTKKRVPRLAPSRRKSGIRKMPTEVDLTEIKRCKQLQSLCIEACTKKPLSQCGTNYSERIGDRTARDLALQVCYHFQY